MKNGGGESKEDMAGREQMSKGLDTPVPGRQPKIDGLIPGQLRHGVSMAGVAILHVTSQ